METYGYMNLNLNNSDLSQEELNKLNKVLPSSSFNFGVAANYESIPSSEEYSTEEQSNKQEAARNELNEIIKNAKHNRLHHLKSKIEAILFLSDRPRGVESIAGQAETDIKLVRECLIQLVQEYEDRGGGISIDTTNGYCMQISDEFESLTENILPIEIRTAVLRTLSTIALKEPIIQKDLVTIRGGGVYEHVKELIEMGLVKKSKDSNSHILHTTKFFQENFKLSQNGLGLQNVLKSASPSEVEFVRPNSLISDDDETLTNIQENIENSKAIITEDEDIAIEDSSELY